MPIEADKGRHRRIGPRPRAGDAGVRGSVDIEVECRPAFDYARVAHTVREVQHGCLFTAETTRTELVSLLASVPLTIEDGVARARFTIHEGEWVGFVLEWVEGHHRA